MFRSIGAVLLGYLTVMISIMVFGITVALLLLGKIPGPDDRQSALTFKVCLAYVAAGLVFGTLGSYVTALVARRRELAHGIALTVFTAAIGVPYFIARVSADERPEPLWYLVTVIFVLPAITGPLGASLRARQVARREIL